VFNWFKSKKEDHMKFLIVGLGNIGEDYKNTRHNIGFDVVDQWVTEREGEWDSGRLAFVAKFKYRGKQVVCIKPTTFMNLSGKAVSHWMKTEKIPLKNILVVTDDLSLDLGKLRLRGKGSAGGHNGLKDIQAQLGTQDYNRLRFGVGANFPKGRQVEFVLGRWKSDEEIEVALQKDRATKAIEAWIFKGLSGAMNEFNTK
jgi:PTH1 family peptidyl-tRNA hydrolase